MQYNIFETISEMPQKDYSNQKVMIGLSGGINSMSILCWLSEYPEHLKPLELHLFYAHFEEHSPDTLPFVLDGIEFAKKHFKSVFSNQTDNSILESFEEWKMIPHPMIAPCTRLLKIEPMLIYMVENKISIDLVGYVRTEARRVKNMAAKSGGGMQTIACKLEKLRNIFRLFRMMMLGVLKSLKGLLVGILKFTILWKMANVFLNTITAYPAKI
jgi:hypothetical protein